MKNKISIGYFADGPWSHLAFEKLIKDEDIEIKFIVPRSDTTDKTLKNYATEFGIDYLSSVKINEPSFIEKVTSYECDLLVSMSFNQIFRAEILKSTKHGVINCHAGKLPFYRGRNILNWALINDEKEFGITVHFVDEGIDTGDIILQRVFPITDEDSYASLLQIAYVECANILYDAIKLMQAKNFERINQSTIHPTGFYCGTRSAGDEIINWDQNSRDLFNFIRALNHPGPKATSFLNEIEVKINSSNFIQDAPSYKGTVGQILSKTRNGFLVKTRDSFLEILEVESDTKIKVGMRFKQDGR